MEVDAAIRIFNDFRIKHITDQVFDIKSVALGAFNIDGISQLIPIEADDQCPDAAKGFSLSQCVLIEQNLLSILQRIFLSAIDGVLPALLGARIIEVFASLLRDS